MTYITITESVKIWLKAKFSPGPLQALSLESKKFIQNMNFLFFMSARLKLHKKRDQRFLIKYKINKYVNQGFIEIDNKVIDRLRYRYIDKT